MRIATRDKTALRYKEWGTGRPVIFSMEWRWESKKTGPRSSTRFSRISGSSLISHPVGCELLDWSRSVAMMAALKATLECAQSFATTDFRPDLSHFKVPTSIIHGTDDKTVPGKAGII